MKRKLFILCERYYDFNRNKISIGGIQTYVSNLCKIAQELGFHVVVIQKSFEDRRDFVDSCEILSVKTSHLLVYRLQSLKLFLVYWRQSSPSDILLYATEGFAQRWKKGKTIGIQHGISWDIPSDVPTNRLSNVFASFRQLKNSLWLTKKISYLDKLVCVDYNFVNWYKTQVKHPECEYSVVPNFTHIPNENEIDKSSDGKVRIIFARRFQKYRGTRLFSNVIVRLLQEYDNIEVTIAGEGPDADYMHQYLDKFSNVRFIKFSANESLKVHSAVDIAVVPTIGSEGTSLSLLEAMASKCAVICTNVGGMSNIVIDNYNGLIINPEEKALYQALKLLITDESLRNRLAIKARETAEYGFSYSQWKDKWIKILNNL